MTVSRSSITTFITSSGVPSEEEPGDDNAPILRTTRRRGGGENERKVTAEALATGATGGPATSAFSASSNPSNNLVSANSEKSTSANWSRSCPEARLMLSCSVASVSKPA